MNREKLKKLRRQLNELRQNVRNLEHRKLEKLALELGRVRFERGKEPTYIMQHTPPGGFPLSIPGHPKTLAVGTAKNILNILEQDLERWEATVGGDDDGSNQE